TGRAYARIGVERGAYEGERSAIERGVDVDAQAPGPSRSPGLVAVGEQSGIVTGRASVPDERHGVQIEVAVARVRDRPLQLALVGRMYDDLEAADRRRLVGRHRRVESGIVRGPDTDAQPSSDDHVGIVLPYELYSPAMP